MNDRHKIALMILGHPAGEKKMAEGGEASDEMECEKDPGLEAAAEDLIHAVHAKDTAAVVHALHSAFMIMESHPHDESEYADGGKVPGLGHPTTGSASLAHQILRGG